jgi:hypothetical protein
MRHHGWVAVLCASIVAAVLCGACGPKPTPTAKTESAVRASPAVTTPAVTTPAVTTPVQPTPDRYGQALEPAPTADLAAVLDQPAAYADKSVTVEGVVRQVCQNRGCWLELATAADADAHGCRVVLKDHAFFVPTDSAGRRARVQGNAEVKTVSPMQVAHMEEEGARFQRKNADGSAHEVRIIASGVELLPRPAAL